METPDRLTSTLAQLTEQGADRFDPVRFRYITSLMRRSARKPLSVRRRLTDKALTALDEYQRRFEVARKEATHQLTARMARKQPAQTEPSQRPCEQCDCHGIQQRFERDDREVERSGLSALNDQIARAGRLAGDQAEHGSLIALMQKQEEEIVASMRDPSGDQGAPMALGDGRLRAIHFFEKNRADDHAHRFVFRAINTVPENPGHLNSQMLVTRCLTAMHRLAPDYLRHWMSYMETLLWLEGRAGKKKNRA